MILESFKYKLSHNFEIKKQDKRMQKGNLY